MLVSISGFTGLIGRELIDTYTDKGMTFRISRVTVRPGQASSSAESN